MEAWRVSAVASGAGGRRRRRVAVARARAAGLRREAVADGVYGARGAAYKGGARPREAESRAAAAPPVSWPDSGKVVAARLGLA